MNQGYDFTQAARFLNSTESLDLEYIEQPLPVNQFDAMAALRSRCKTPVAINEDCYIPHNLFEFIRQKAIDLAVVDLDPWADHRAGKWPTTAPKQAAPGQSLGSTWASSWRHPAVYAATALSHAVDSTYMGHADTSCRPLQIVRCISGSPGPGLGVTVTKIRSG
jgi:L-alanine-DL-glutamate epimerase-like enolase superfamily enzyme